MLRKALFLLVLLGLGGVGYSPAAEVFPGHPRLFFRDQAWGEPSITTAVLRQRAQDPRYSRHLDLLTRRSPCNQALRWVMLDDRESALKCIEGLKQPFGFDGTTDDGIQLMWDAMAFDWLYNNPDFSAADKQAVIDKLAGGARWCIDQYEHQGAHIFHTRMYAFPTGVAIAGLALKGHHPEADRFMQWGYDKYRKDLFPARRIQDGTVHNSIAYGRKYTMWSVGHFLAAWYSATGENLWKTIREKQGDWAWREALFLIYAQQPDGSLVRYGDNFFRGADRFSLRAVSERAFAYGEPVGAWYVSRLLAAGSDHKDSRMGEEVGSEYNAFLYWDADNAGRSVETLPTRMLFSPRGTGMAFWRSGWGKDDTFIFSKCGDYFDNHGHFDAGHVEVFRRAPLLIEAGTYAGGTESEHYKKFFHQSIAHNTIQIEDPRVPGDDGSQRFYNNQSQGTIEKYLSNPLNEYGNIVQYRDEQGWPYLAEDFTAAYEPGRVKKVVRELAWLGERYLVVIDNISLADSGLKPKILWHYPVVPSLENGRLTVSASGARAVISVLAPAGAVLDTVPEYKVGDAFYPPSKPSPSMGVGRAEVSLPGTGRTEYTFVQVIDIADDGAAGSAPELKAGRSPNALKVILPAGTLSLAGKPGDRTTIEFKTK
jgi:hypothetical protein